MVDEKLVLLKNFKSQYEIIKNNYRKFSKEQLNELKNLRIEISNLINNKNDYFLKDYNQIKKYIEENPMIWYELLKHVIVAMPSYLLFQ